VAEAAGNPFMASISALVEVALTAVFIIGSPVEDEQKLAETCAAHQRIARAIDAGDADEARAAMRAVITDGFDRSAGLMGEDS
jgi:DNA-binding FadR family transcriptional regulator